MKVAVAVASRHGSTAEVADAIADELRSSGHEVSVLPVETLDGTPEGDAVIVGSPLYLGRWMKDARHLAADLAAEAGDRPLYAFTCGPLGDPPEPEVPDGEEILGPIEPLVRLHEVLGGRLDPGELNRRERLVAGAVKAPEGDFRDFDAARAFARRVDRDLRSGV